ncbi:AMP-binding protein [Nocardiopsis coralli]|nr:AMP-binding protein [Nocardiopsis coralli]
MSTHLEDLRARQAQLRPSRTPSEVRYPLGETTLPAHLSTWAEQVPDRPAIVFEGAEVNYRELDVLVRRTAGWLRDEAGVGAGDRVAVLMPNRPHFTVVMLAALTLGAVHVPVNPMFREAELAHELEDADPRVVVALEPLLPLLREARPSAPGRSVLVLGEDEQVDHPRTGTAVPLQEGEHPWSAAVAHTPIAPDDPSVSRDLDALAALNYTGGTTGLPKGCMHTQRHMLYTAAACAGATGRTGGAVVLCYVPIFWIAGEDLGILLPLVTGGTVVLLPRWDAGRALAAIDRHRVSVMVGTVENYLELLDHPDLGSHDLSSLTDPSAMSFVRKLDPQIRARWSAEVGSGSVLREAAYGLTESHTFDATPYGLADGDRDLRSEPVFCGLPVPGTDVAVVSFETGEPLPIGTEGEIVLRSPSVMTGYWNRPDATARQLRDGWLHTGDNGRMDEDGCLHYLGRDKDLIKVKGMSVFPAEVEVLLGRHPGVDSVAVVAAQDPDSGQRPVAFVTPAVNPAGPPIGTPAGTPEAGAAPTAEELTAWARENMALYKVPIVEVVDAFPVTATGKVRKVDLTERAEEAAARDRDRRRGRAGW